MPRWRPCSRKAPASRAREAGGAFRGISANWLARVERIHLGAVITVNISDQSHATRACPIDAGMTPHLLETNLAVSQRCAGSRCNEPCQLAEPVHSLGTAHARYVWRDEYLLYLREIGSNTYRVVNPEGRIREGANGSVPM